MAFFTFAANPGRLRAPVVSLHSKILPFVSQMSKFLMKAGIMRDPAVFTPPRRWPDPASERYRTPATDARTVAAKHRISQCFQHHWQYVSASLGCGLESVWSCRSHRISGPDTAQAASASRSAKKARYLCPVPNRFLSCPPRDPSVRSLVRCLDNIPKLTDCRN